MSETTKEIILVILLIISRWISSREHKAGQAAIQHLHIAINSRMDAALKAERAAGVAEGKLSQTATSKPDIKP